MPAAMALPGGTRWVTAVPFLAGGTAAGCFSPSFENYKGDDPDGHALAVNIARRHMSKGQIGIVSAEANRLFNNRSASKTGNAADVSKATIVQANVVLDYAPDLAAQVKAGTTPLNAAYETAKQRKKASESSEVSMQWI